MELLPVSIIHYAELSVSHFIHSEQYVMLLELTLTLAKVLKIFSS